MFYSYFSGKIATFVFPDFIFSNGCSGIMVMCQGSMLSDPVQFISLHLWDKICEELHVQISYISGIMVRGPQIFQYKSVSVHFRTYLKTVFFKSHLIYL